MLPNVFMQCTVIMCLWQQMGESVKVMSLRCYSTVCHLSKDIWLMSENYMLMVIEETVVF